MRINDWTDCIEPPTRCIAKLEKSTKKKSWTRLTYETAYRLCRRTASEKAVWWIFTDPPEIMRAADYSYQARDYDLHAWTNDMRRHRFHAIKHSILTQREVYPF